MTEIEAIRHAVYAGDTTRSPERDVRTLLLALDAAEQSRDVWYKTAQRRAKDAHTAQIALDKLRTGVEVLLDEFTKRGWMHPHGIMQEKFYALLSTSSVRVEDD